MVFREKRMHRLFVILLLVFPASPLPADPGPAPAPGLLLISIDGLRPDYVTRADDHGLKIPNLRRLLRDGVHASGVRGVLPTSTYSGHTTIITGAAPARHGIVWNNPFAGPASDRGNWYWYAEDIRVPTLWQAAARAGRVVGSVSWPVSVGAEIAFNIPEYNLTRTADDAKMVRALVPPGLMAELEGKAGPYVMDLEQAVLRDESRTRWAVEILRQKRAQFLAVHLAATDHFQHRHGPFSPPVLDALEKIDAMIGDLAGAVLAADPKAVIAVVSDHGFARVDRELRLDAAFVEAGLISCKTRGGTLEDSKVGEWTAMPWSSGGSAAILMKNPGDAGARRRVGDLLASLAADPANGIASVLDRPALDALGASPDAAFWVDLRPGVWLNPSLDGPRAGPISVRGSHGYSPEHPEMNSLFLIAGAGVRRGVELDVIDMRAIAPTLARAMGIPFPSAELPPLNVFE